MKDNKKKILSVSVASYNLGEMIETNIKSFCESKVADKIELIVTDDGSKDDTPEIIEKYAKIYPNTIKFIKKKNEGPGSTVNSGIKNATGKYFRMVDGDDWVKTENLENFINFLENIDADVIVSNYELYDNSLKKIIKTISYNIPSNKLLNLCDYYKNTPYDMWALTFKTKIFKDNNIVLDNCFYTDTEYTLYAMRYVNTLAYINESIYVYRIAQANQSVSVSSFKKNISQYEKVSLNSLNFFKKEESNLTLAQKEYLISKLVNVCDFQLKIYLSFNSTREIKIKIKNFINNIKNNYISIYDKMKKNKKLMLLEKSNYLLYPLLSKIIRNRIKKDSKI